MHNDIGTDLDTALKTQTEERRAKPAPIPPEQPVYSAAQFSKQKAAVPPPPRAVRARRARSRQRKAMRRKRRNEWAWVLLAAGMISIFACLILAVFIIARIPQSAQLAIPTADLTPSLPTPVDARSEFIADGRRVGVDVLKLADGSLVDLVPWDGQSRYTIIIAGLDRRQDQNDEPVRTDSLMLLSIDPVRKSIGILSIPRDLWVQIPDQEERDRINRAYFLGELRRPGDGALLLQQTVSWNLGMRVHNYILVDFQALIDIVDLLGGIEVTIEYTISDERSPDLNYGYDPLYMPAGTHQLDGYNALRFARTRHGNNDVKRAERQQQVLYAIRDRALSIDFLQLIRRLPAFLSTVSAHLQTGLDLQQIIQLAYFAREIDFNDITMRVMDFNYVQEYTTEEYQQQVLIPIVERLPKLLSETFGQEYSGR